MNSPNLIRGGLLPAEKFRGNIWLAFPPPMNKHYELTTDARMSVDDHPPLVFMNSTTRVNSSDEGSAHTADNIVSPSDIDGSGDSSPSRSFNITIKSSSALQIPISISHTSRLSPIPEQAVQEEAVEDELELTEEDLLGSTPTGTSPNDHVLRTSAPTGDAEIIPASGAPRNSVQSIIGNLKHLCGGKRTGKIAEKGDDVKLATLKAAKEEARVEMENHICAVQRQNV